MGFCDVCCDAAGTDGDFDQLVSERGEKTAEKESSVRFTHGAFFNRRYQFVQSRGRADRKSRQNVR